MLVEISPLPDAELIINPQDVPSLQGGQMSWKEMAVEGLEATPCSRKANQKANKRPRIITIDKVKETVTFTSTSIITETDTATTATFSVSVRLWSAWLVASLLN